MRSFWRDLPIMAGAVFTGMVLVVVGSIPKNLLFAANLKFLQSVPWAAPLTALYLWLFWRYLQGAWWPQSTAEARRANLRANRLSAQVWIWALLAGVLGIVVLVLALRVMNRLVRLPQEQFFDVAQVPFVTVLSLLLMGAVAAGIVEEASFRGYMQGPIERSYGPVAAIAVTGIFFGLAHYSTITLVLMPYYVAVAAIYGTMTYLTNSILPGVVLHTAGNIWSGSYLWARGHAEWQASSQPGPLIWETGTDASFWRYSVATLIVGAVMVWAYAKLAAVARHALSTPSSPRHRGSGLWGPR